MLKPAHAAGFLWFRGSGTARRLHQWPGISELAPRRVFKWIARCRAEGPVGLDDRSSRPHRVAHRHLQPGKELSDAVFALLHTPPRDSGFNRTTWRLADLRSALQAQGVSTTPNNLSTVIKRAGYQWKKARVTLTSSDPLYREKVVAIKDALSKLREDEAFFSIDCLLL
jgi:transposase